MIPLAFFICVVRCKFVEIGRSLVRDEGVECSNHSTPTNFPLSTPKTDGCFAITLCIIEGAPRCLLGNATLFAKTRRSHPKLVFCPKRVRTSNPVSVARFSSSLKIATAALRKLLLAHLSRPLGRKLRRLTSVRFSDTGPCRTAQQPRGPVSENPQGMNRGKFGGSNRRYGDLYAAAGAAR